MDKNDNLSNKKQNRRLRRQKSFDASECGDCSVTTNKDRKMNIMASRDPRDVKDVPVVVTEKKASKNTPASLRSSPKIGKQCSLDSAHASSRSLVVSDFDTTRCDLSRRRSCKTNKGTSLDDSAYDYRKKNAMADLLLSTVEMMIMSASDSQITAFADEEVQDIQLSIIFERRTSSTRRPPSRRWLVTEQTPSQPQLGFDCAPSSCCLQLNPSGKVVMTRIETLEEDAAI